MAELDRGAVFAGYRIDGVAGRGGMGVVYRATELALDRTVALKVVADGLLGDERARARFIHESRVAAAIEHPHVIPIHAAGEQEGRAYIVMRLVRGEDLAARLRRVGRLPPAAAVAIVAEVAAALDAAHAAGLVHRDVKPANVLLDVGDHVWLTDFGIARQALSTAGVTGTGAWVGTLDYIAPELVRGEPVDGRADVYALGCMLHRVLTGDVPFPRPNDEARLWAHLHAAPPRASALVPGLPRGFDAVVARALAKAPEDRWPRAGDLATAAADVVAGRPGRASLPRGGRASRPRPARGGAPAHAERPGGRRPPSRAAVGAALAVAAGGAVAALAVGGGGRDATGPASGTPRVAASVRVADRPASLAVAEGALWVGAAGVVQRVDASSRRARAGASPVAGVADLTLWRRELWAAVPSRRHVVRLRLPDGRRTRQRPLRLRAEPARIAAGAGAVWVAEQDRSGGPGALVRVDPRGHRVAGRLRVPEGINDVHAGLGAVWVVLRSEPTLLKVSPRTLRVLDRLRVGDKPLRIDIGAGRVWVTNHDDDSVSRVDPRTGEATLIAVPRKPYGLAVRGHHVWIACFADSTLVRIDTRRNRVVGRPIAVGLNPVGVAADGGSVWVSNRGDDTVSRIDAR